MEDTDFVNKLQALSPEQLLSFLTQSQKDAICLAVERKDESVLLGRLEELRGKYFDLVWMARKSPKDLKDPNLKRIFNETSAKYPGELQKLQGPEGDWRHGFNSGMLASVRLIGEYISPLDNVFHPEYAEELLKEGKSLRQEAIKKAERDFPVLDT